ncbi:MAG TPA: hypothetical protein VK647_14750 [Gemmatimonadales bacterium]|jgi:hypothetical protein|nr:hypothetical protein [Gemmatimonadales bacterium]
MPLRALIIWFTLLLVAVANGGFRQALLIPRFGPHPGHIVSTGMLCAGILIVTFLAIPWIHPASRGDTIAVGLAWLALTLAFEFGFGRARGKPWAELLAAYDVLKGRIWVLVLVTTAVAPYLAARARGLLPHPPS